MFVFISHLTVPEEDREAFRRYMKSREHAESHSREPKQIMARTDVRHDAYRVMMDSRARPEWIREDGREEEPEEGAEEEVEEA